MGRKRKCQEARANQLCRFFKMGTCTAGGFCPLSHAATASKKGQQQGGVDVSLMLEGDPVLNEGGIRSERVRWPGYAQRDVCAIG